MRASIETLWVGLSRHRDGSSKFHDLHTELDHLLRGVSSVSSTSIHTDWRLTWADDQETILAAFSEEVQGDSMLQFNFEGEAFGEAEHILRGELEKQSTQSEPAKLELLSACLEKVLRLFRLQTAALPSWFVPLRDLKFEGTLSPAGDKVKPGKWLSSNVLVRECHLERKTFAGILDQWSQLSHPNLIKIFGAYHLHQPQLVAFESAKSTSLSEHLRLNQHVTWQKLYEVGLGLKYLHEREFVFGNFTCDHIWIGTNGLAKIVPSALDDLQPGNWRDDEAGLQASFADQYGESPSTATDIYMFGACIFEAFTGLHWFQGLSDAM